MISFIFGVSCRPCHRFFMSSCAVASRCLSQYHMASFYIYIYMERHTRFLHRLGTMPVPRSRPEQLIDNTVDAIRFAWRPSYLPARLLFTAVPAAEAKSKVSPRAQIVWDDEMELEGKEGDIKKRICNSFHLSPFSLSLFFFEVIQYCPSSSSSSFRKKKDLNVFIWQQQDQLHKCGTIEVHSLLNLIWISDISCNHTRITKVGLDYLLYNSKWRRVSNEVQFEHDQTTTPYFCIFVYSGWIFRLHSSSWYGGCAYLSCVISLHSAGAFPPLLDIEIIARSVLHHIHWFLCFSDDESRLDGLYLFVLVIFFFSSPFIAFYPCVLCSRIFLVCFPYAQLPCSFLGWGCWWCTA